MTAAGLVLSAWLALAVWSMSPYAEWLDHARIEDIAAPLTVRLAVFTLGWTLMIIAMMLPGTLLLLARCLENKPFSARRIAPVILAYLAVWMVFGSFSYLGDSVLHEIVEQVPALAGAIAPGSRAAGGHLPVDPDEARLSVEMPSPKAQRSSLWHSQAAEACGCWDCGMACSASEAVGR